MKSKREVGESGDGKRIMMLLPILQGGIEMLSYLTRPLRGSNNLCPAEATGYMEKQVYGG